MQETLKSIIIGSRISQQEVEFLELCILRLYAHQEHDEQQARSTIYRNGVGFNRLDGKYFAPIAERLKAKVHIIKDELVPTVSHKLYKYSKQLSELLSDEEAGL